MTPAEPVQRERQGRDRPTEVADLCDFLFTWLPGKAS